MTLPPNLPIPADHVLLGTGRNFSAPRNFEGYYWKSEFEDSWRAGISLGGHQGRILYCAPKGSEVARANYDNPESMDRQVHPWITPVPAEWAIAGWGPLPRRERFDVYVLREGSGVWEFENHNFGGSTRHIYAFRIGTAAHTELIDRILKTKAEMTYLQQLIQ